MALLKKKEEKKPFVVRSSGGAGGEVSPLRPQARMAAWNTETSPHTTSQTSWAMKNSMSFLGND